MTAKNIRAVDLDPEQLSDEELQALLPGDFVFEFEGDGNTVAMVVGPQGHHQIARVVTEGDGSGLVISVTVTPGGSHTATVDVHAVRGSDPEPNVIVHLGGTVDLNFTAIATVGSGSLYGPMVAGHGFQVLVQTGGDGHAGFLLTTSAAATGSILAAVLNDTAEFRIAGITTT